MTDTPTAEHAYMQIGEVAERTGLTPRTLRYYEEKGLLAPPSRMEGGFRLYSEEDVERVERIKKMRDLLGFSLADIREMIQADDVKDDVRRHFRELATDQERRAALDRAIASSLLQLELIDQKLSQLAEMRQGIEDRLARYRAAMDRLGG